MPEPDPTYPAEFERRLVEPAVRGARSDLYKFGERELSTWSRLPS